MLEMTKTSLAKVLVVFFSRSGTTRKVAQALAHASGADVEELRESRSRGGIWGYLRSGYEATYRRSSPDLLPCQRDPRDYDLVFIGTPTWSASLSSPVRAYLEQQRSALSNTALFVTCGGPRADGVLAQMSGLLAKPPLATVALSEAEVKRSPAVLVGEFLEMALVAWEKQRSK
jgi:flavodoxin